MFTGIVQGLGRVAGVDTRPDGARLRIDPCGWAHHAGRGDSISISGCCLTIAGFPDGEDPSATLEFDAIPETLSRTTLGGLAVGARVNLERSLRAADPMGGHIVQGHVEGVGTVVRADAGPEHRLTVRAPADLMDAIVPKGSIALDGVSLTIAAVEPRRCEFEVALIPTTLRLTTLGALSEGDACNIETDIIARSVAHWLRSHPPR